MPPPRKRARRRDGSGRFVSDKEPTLPPPTPPSQTVLNTTELLETILLGLDPKTLLLSQRVSRSWQALIVTSLPLRRALFLEPVPCGDISYLNWRLDDKDWYGTLDLGEHVRGFDRDQRPITYQDHWGKTRDDAGRYRIFVNPLLTTMFPFLTRTGIYWDESMSSLSKEANRPEASWRQMFFTQPPVNCMAVEYDSKDDGDDGDGDSRSTVDWTIMPVRKDVESMGLTMVQLFSDLVHNGAPAWIEGRHVWEDYRGAEDLGRVVVRGGSG